MIEEDTWASIAFYHDWMRLKLGLRRFRTLQEMYWLEQWGEVP